MMCDFITVQPYCTVIVLDVTVIHPQLSHTISSMRSGSSLCLSTLGFSSAVSQSSSCPSAGFHQGIRWCSVFYRLVACRWKSVLGSNIVVAVDLAGAATLAAAGPALAVPATVACLARAALSRGAAEELESHGLFCCAVALLLCPFLSKVQLV